MGMLAESNAIRQQWLEPQFDNIPDQLKQQPWAVWKAEPRPNKPGKFNKAPRSPATGMKIGANKPELFGTYDEAVSAYQRGGYTGIGVLLTGNGIVGVDIDDAESTFASMPNLKAWLASAIKDGAYCERSPSGTGLRLFIKGALPGTGRKSGPLEIYDNTRFLTVTGYVFPPKNGGA